GQRAGARVLWARALLPRAGALRAGAAGSRAGGVRRHRAGSAPVLLHAPRLLAPERSRSRASPGQLGGGRASRDRAAVLLRDAQRVSPPRLPAWHGIAARRGRGARPPRARGAP